MKYSFPQIAFVALEHIVRPFIDFFRYWRMLWLCWRFGILAGKHVSISGKVIFRTRHKGEIVLGDNVTLNSVPEYNLVGLNGPTILDTCGGGQIVIGKHSGASSVVISSRRRVQIGDYVKIGGNVRIFDHDFHSLSSEIRRTAEDSRHARIRPIIIDDDVFIGTNAIILKGTHIGARSIIAAGSVVYGLIVPPDSMVKGNPATIKKPISVVTTESRE